MFEIIDANQTFPIECDFSTHNYILMLLHWRFVLGVALLITGCEGSSARVVAGATVQREGINSVATSSMS